MRTWHLLSAAIASSLFAVMASGGCGVVLGLGDYEDQPGAASSGSGGGVGGSSSVTGSSAATSSGTTGGGASGAAGTGGTGAGPAGSGGSAPGGGGTGGTPVMCNGANTCIGAIPAGWTGPVSLFSGPGSGSPPACVGDYGTKVGDYFEDLIPGSAQCQCTCDPAHGIQCTASATVCYSSDCFSICNTTNATLAPGACTSITVSNLQDAHVSNPPPTAIGSCQAHDIPQIPTPTWTSALRGCSGPVPTSDGCMAGEVCAPAPPDALCVAHGGDTMCPDAFYSEKHLVFEGFMDGRTCSPCSCGAPNSKCDGTVDFTSQSCMILLNTVNAGGCGQKGNGGTNPNGAIYGPTPSGTCQTAGGQLSGTVTETSALTFCCHP